VIKLTIEAATPHGAGAPALIDGRPQLTEPSSRRESAALRHSPRKNLMFDAQFRLHSALPDLISRFTEET